MMEGRKILITGGSSGIGKSTALHLNSLGASIILVARDKNKMEHILSQMRGEENYAISLDLRETEMISIIQEFLIEKNLKLDGLVHAAGMLKLLPVKSNNRSTIMEMMEVNFLSFAELIKLFATKKYSNDQASIVAISSIEVGLYAKGHSGYTASKAALDALVKSAAKEFSTRKIRVNSIRPALVDTPMAQNLTKIRHIVDGEKLDSIGIIPPEQIAYLAEFLLSDKSQYITGESIAVGAGYVM